MSPAHRSSSTYTDDRHQGITVQKSPTLFRKVHRSEEHVERKKLVPEWSFGRSRVPECRIEIWVRSDHKIDGQTKLDG